jgi:hypothetical protein
MVRAAAARGAQVILLQELFEAPYFCQLQRADFFHLATVADVQQNALLKRFAALAAELQVQNRTTHICQSLFVYCRLWYINSLHKLKLVFAFFEVVSNQYHCLPLCVIHFIVLCSHFSLSLSPLSFLLPPHRWCFLSRSLRRPATRTSTR